MNVFDTEARARAFMESRRLDSRIFAVRGSATLTLMDHDFFLLLNPETPHQKLLPPEEISWLRGEPDAFVRFSAPASDLSQLVPASPEPASFAAELRSILEAEPEVLAAYVFRHPTAGTDAQRPSYLIALRVRSGRADSEAIMQVVGSALQGKIGTGDDGEARFVDFIVGDRRKLRALIGGDLDPFYER